MSDDKIKMTSEQVAVMDHLNKRLLEARREVRRWEIDLQRSAQEFAVDLGIDLREDWNYQGGKFVRIGETKESEAETDDEADTPAE